MCIVAGIAGAAIGGIGGAAISGSAAQSAAGEQAGASEAATGVQQQMFNQVQGNEARYQEAGAGAQSQLNYLLGIGQPGQGGTGAGSSAGGYGSLLQPFTSQYMQQYSPAYHLRFCHQPAAAVLLRLPR